MGAVKGHVQVIRGWDLFTIVPENGYYLVAHGVNDIGAWGRGFTESLDANLPWAREQYLRWHKHGGTWPTPPGPLQLGGCFTGHATGKDLPAVAHLCVQRGLRSTTNRTPFRLDALRAALGALSRDLRAYPADAAVWMPAVGTGLGGYPAARENDILTVVEDFARDAGRTVFFCSLDTRLTSG